MPYIYQPQYLKYFKCAAGGCQHNCCEGWEIFVDQDTYEHYASLEDETLRQRLLDNIELNDKGGPYARIKLDENRKCPFNTPEGLCEIQSRLGHKALSEVCGSYPRLFLNVAGETEVLMTMSCEVAVNAAMFSTSLLTLEKVDADPNRTYKFNNRLNVSKYTAAENGIDLFWDLRSAVIYIIQNRRYPVWFRLVILGFFIKDADDLILAGGEDGIPVLAEEFISRIESGLYDESLKSIPDRPDVKIAFVFGILDQVGKASPTAKNLFGECVSEMRKGLGLETSDLILDEAVSAFSHVSKTFYAPFFKDLEYVFENYIANMVYMTGFPFVYGREGRLYDNYLRLVVKYALVKFLLIGMAGYHKQNFNRETIVKGISEFSRIFDHRPKLVDSIVSELEEKNAATVGALCVLIKD